ncbi:MAG: 50S ribosomal protein L13 [Chloroflexota bacterium]
MKTFSAKPSDIKREWHLVDASDQVLGKVSNQVARLLMGKHKTMFCRNLDIGDYVVVTNAAKIQVTGKKAKQKLYHRHSGYPGGQKSISFEEMMQKDPAWVVTHAVKGMLPSNRLSDTLLKRLRVFADDVHPHQSQITTVPVVEQKDN